MTTPLITLDMPTVLRAARKAFDNGYLQAQNQDGSGSCYYAGDSGPCAIGAALPREIGKKIDHDYEQLGVRDTSIRTLIEAHIVEAPADQLDDFSLLQAVHDDWVGSPTHNFHHERFVATLKQLEAKYVVGH